MNYEARKAMTSEIDPNRAQLRLVRSSIDYAILLHVVPSFVQLYSRTYD